MITKNWTQHIPSFLILLIIFILILNSPLKTWPVHDEIVSISTFVDFRSLFLKYIPNNHTVTGFIGFISNNLFGVNILFLRSISFIFFILIIFIVSFKEKDNFVPILFLAIYLSYNTLADYSFLFRGYYFLSFGFIILYYFLKKIEDKKNIKNIYLLSSILLIHSLGSIYLILPIIFFLVLKNFKDKEFTLINYFLLPTLAFYIISIPVTGAYVHKNLLFKIFDAKNYIEIIFFLPKIYFDGLKEIISPKLLIDYPSIISNYNLFFESFYYNKIILILFLISFIKSILFIFKKRRIIDFAIFSLFLIILILNKMPPERLLISYVFILILYLIGDFNYKQEKFSYHILITKLFLLIFISYKTINFKILSSNEINLVENKTNKTIEEKCILNLNSKNQFDYHYFYYIYLTKCKKKPNIFEFYKFYKTRLI